MVAEAVGGLRTFLAAHPADAGAGAGDTGTGAGDAAERLQDQLGQEHWRELLAGGRRVFADLGEVMAFYITSEILHLPQQQLPQKLPQSQQLPQQLLLSHNSHHYSQPNVVHIVYQL